MPTFKTEEEAVATHKHYNIDTDREGKYNLSNRYNIHWNRINFILGNVPEFSHVLEVGCNSGGLLRMLSSERHCYCNGIDISLEMVKRAVEKGFSCKLSKAEEIPYADETFDVVICTEVLEHIFDVDKVLKEIRRVLRPGGTFIGTVPHNESYNSKRMKTDEHKWHCHKFTAETIKKHLDKYFTVSGMEDISWYNDQENQPQWIGWVCV